MIRLKRVHFAFLILFTLTITKTSLAQKYNVVILTPNGFSSSEARGISGDQQVGYGWPYASKSITHALLWSGTAESYVDLHPNGFSYSRAYGIYGNQQAGYGTGTATGNNYHALLWSGTAESYVDLNPNGFSYSHANGIYGNQQVGYGYSTTMGNYYHALLWSGTAESYVDLNPNGFSSSEAFGLSIWHQVGCGWGVHATGYNTHALLWSGTADSYVDLHPDKFLDSRAWGISGLQQVGCGYEYSMPGGYHSHALLWSGSANSYVDLNPTGFSYSEAIGISEGQQVGYGAGTATGNNDHALLWSGTAVSYVDLHSYLPSQFIQSYANSIDSSGNICGTATVTGSVDDVPPGIIYAVMWIPYVSPYTIYLPEIETLSANNVTSGTATLSGSLKYDGCDEIEENCMCRISYWKNGEQGNTKSTNWQSEISQGQNFDAAITDLEPNTVYFFFAQAINSTGMDIGNTLSFKTYPDPNAPPVAFNPSEPNTLLIQNFVKVFQNDPNKLYNNQVLFTYVEKSGNSNGLDFNDVLYSAPESMSSKIVSLIPVLNLQGKIIDFNELYKDARPDNAQISLLELSIYSPEPLDSNISSENSLKFWLEPNAFKGKTVTIQKVSQDPNIIYPVWDVNEIITSNSRKMPLNNLVNQKLNDPYAWFTLSTSRQIVDLNGDGVVNLADYALLQADVGKNGIYRNDIASLKNKSFILGIPDRKVNAIDEVAFINEYNKKNPSNPIPNPYTGLTEDFESGQIQDPLVTSGSSPWIIDSNSHEGQFCAKSGDISDNQNSILQATIKCVIGQISFYQIVSSEGYDNLIFYIDGVEKGRWSGELDWEEMTYQITPGTHTLKWEYKKDWTLSEGEDAAWIDDIVVQ